jgi:hypothetical protein
VLTPERVREVWAVEVWRGVNAASGAPVVFPVARGE